MTSEAPAAAKERPLPPDWRWARLRDVARVSSGSAAPQDKTFFSNGEFPFVRVSDLGAVGRMENLTAIRDCVNQRAVNELNLVRVPRGTVVFPKSGAAIFTNNRAILGTDAYIVSHLAAVTPVDGLTTSDWLYYWLCTLDMIAFSDNPGYPSLKTTRVALIPIPLPPLAVQRRIVAVLRQQMGAVQRARAAALARLEAARALPAAFLRAVFDSDEAQHWPRVRLGDVTDLYTGTTPPRGRTDYFGGTIPWVKTTELLDSIIEDTEEHVTEEALDATPLRLLPGGTLLVGMIGQGQTRGRTALLAVPGTTNQNCCAIVPNPERFDTPFLQLWFRHSYSLLRSESEARGGGQPALNVAMVKSLRVPLPDTHTQRHAAQRFFQRSPDFHRAGEHAEAQLAAIDALPQAILRRAFAGEL